MLSRSEYFVHNVKCLHLYEGFNRYQHVINGLDSQMVVAIVIDICEGKYL